MIGNFSMKKMLDDARYINGVIFYVYKFAMLYLWIIVISNYMYVYVP